MEQPLNQESVDNQIPKAAIPDTPPADTKVEGNIAPPPPINDKSPNNALLDKPKSKSFLFKIFVVLIFFFIILILGMLILKSLSNPKTLPSPTPKNIETPVSEESPTADWVLYVQKSLAFQLKIPKDWRTETNTEQPNTVWLKAPDESIIEIIATNRANLNLSDYIRKISDESQTAWEGKPSKEFGEEIDTSVGDFSAIETTVKYLAAGFTTTVTYAEVEQKIFSFTILPPPSGDTINNTAHENYSLILSTFKKYIPLDLSKWKRWTDPNEFTLMYPPNAKVNHLNENTTVTVKTDSGTFTLSFCKNCVKDACSGICDKEKEIKIAVNELKYSEKQISPNEDGNFTFRVVLPYPNTFIREKLAIFADYPSEENLDDIDNILSTFKFTEKKKE